MDCGAGTGGVEELAMAAMGVKRSNLLVIFAGR
jgi:hypothetical protein